MTPMPNKYRFRSTTMVSPVKTRLDRDTYVAHSIDITPSAARPGVPRRQWLQITFCLLLLSLVPTVWGQEMSRVDVNATQRANTVILNTANNCDCQVTIRGELSVRDIVPLMRRDEPPQELSLGEIARRIRAERKRREPLILPWPAE